MRYSRIIFCSLVCGAFNCTMMHLIIVFSSHLIFAPISSALFCHIYSLIFQFFLNHDIWFNVSLPLLFNDNFNLTTKFFNFIIFSSCQLSVIYSFFSGLSLSSAFCLFPLTHVQNFYCQTNIFLPTWKRNRLQSASKPLLTKYAGLISIFSNALTIVIKSFLPHFFQFSILKH